MCLEVAAADFAGHLVIGEGTCQGDGNATDDWLTFFHQPSLFGRIQMRLASQSGALATVSPFDDTKQDCSTTSFIDDVNKKYNANSGGITRHRHHAQV